MKTIVIIFSVFLLNGCSFIHFLSISERNSENINESNKLLSKYNIDTSFSFQIYKSCIDSLSIEKYALNTYKLKHGGVASPIQLRMYYSSGVFINGWEQCFGDIGRLGILDSFPFKKVTHLPINDNLTLNNDLSILNIKNKEYLQNEIKKYDFVILLYWAKWAGWYNRDVLNRTGNYLKKYSKKFKIILIAVNTAP